jgi:exopolyphosphatase/guanosine-5'-triphosphate,3'-diphosphate pyrophosphatase
VQLGQDVTAAGVIGPERLELASRALRRQVEDARRAGAMEIAIGATQALRSAENGPEVAQRLATEAGGGPVRILPTQVEAQLAFDGATMTISPGRATVVLDIGGASAQIAWGPAGGSAIHSWLPLGSGSVAMLAKSDPPVAPEWSAMERRVGELIPDLIPLPANMVALGTGGTITNLPRLLGKGRGVVLRLRDVEVVIESFRELSAEELAQRSGVDLERTRLCRGGALILAQMMDLLHLRSIRSSERGLRDGMIAALLTHGENWWQLREAASADQLDEARALLATGAG